MEKRKMVLSQPKNLDNLKWQEINYHAISKTQHEIQYKKTWDFILEIENIINS